MILTDYLRYGKDITWDIALSSSVTHGVIRLPEDERQASILLAIS